MTPVTGRPETGGDGRDGGEPARRSRRRCAARSCFRSSTPRSATASSPPPVPGPGSAGASIFVMDDPGTSMMLVRSGSVRIGYPTPEGRTSCWPSSGPAPSSARSRCSTAAPRSADATAATDCTLLAFERRDFLPLLEHNWRLAEAVLKVVCEPAAPGRRPYRRPRLLRPARPPRQDADRARAARSRAAACRSTDTQGTLAAMVGGSREAVNRCLRKWQKAGSSPSARAASSCRSGGAGRRRGPDEAADVKDLSVAGWAAAGVSRFGSTTPSR